MLDTRRLCFRRLVISDDQFVFELLNDPDWIKYIGERGIRTLEDARFFIRDANASAACTQTGLFAACLLDSALPVGICSVLKRDFLSVIDIGYSFLPMGRGQGLALEAAKALLDFCQFTLNEKRVVAITSAHNRASIRLLAKLGFASIGGVESTLGFSTIFLKDLN